jgi:hypothetical protein
MSGECIESGPNSPKWPFWRVLAFAKLANFWRVLEFDKFAGEWPLLRIETLRHLDCRDIIFETFQNILTVEMLFLKLLRIS